VGGPHSRTGRLKKERQILPLRESNDDCSVAEPPVQLPSRLPLSIGRPLGRALVGLTARAARRTRDVHSVLVRNGGGKGPLGTGSIECGGGKGPLGTGSSECGGGKGPFGTGSSECGGGPILHCLSCKGGGGQLTSVARFCERRN
jgi:hypothetical protein